MRSRILDNSWFLIIAKDHSCQGYIPGETKEEACKNFGSEVEQCLIKKVIKTDKGFVEHNQSEQGKLL